MPRSERLWRSLALMLLAAVSSASIAQEMNAPGGSAILNDFDAQFERYNIAPKSPEVPHSAVDLRQIDIPLEPRKANSRSLGSGIASYYGRRFHGRRTANGERFNMHQLTAAHRSLPFGSIVKVTNPSNGRSVVVRINDRGPFARNRTIDLSRAAAQKIGLIRPGHGRVELTLLNP